MIIEWIEGVWLWDKEVMILRWVGGYGKVFLGVGGKFFDFDVDVVWRVVCI